MLLALVAQRQDAISCCARCASVKHVHFSSSHMCLAYNARVSATHINCRWLAVPKDVVDEEDAKYEENRFKRFSDSSEQDGDSDDGAANDKDEGDQAGASSDKGRAGGGSKWWGRTTRYGEPQSEDSDDFIVDG